MIKTSKMNTRFKNPLVIFLLFLFPFIFNNCGTSSQSTRDDKSNGWIIGEGVGTIVDNEVGKAKDDALNDAKRDAVKKVLGTMIKSKTEIDSGVFQSSELTAKSEGFIETYEILESSAISKNEYKIKIKAKVSEARIEAAIEDMISQQARPIMLVIVEENLFGEKNTSAQSIAGTSIEAEFTGKGFPLVDKATFERVRKTQLRKFNEALSGNNQAAKEIGNLVGAEIVLVGDSSIVSAGPVMEGSKLISVQSDISIRVIETTTGSILTGGQEHAAYPHINQRTGAVEASKKSAALLSKKLVNEISKKWKTGKVSIIELAIQNANYEQVKKIRSELLEKIRGVKAVHRKESAGDIFLLKVEFEGDAFNFADRILDAKLSIPLTVGDVKRNYVELSVK
jgi:hypothetical protein